MRTSLALATNHGVVVTSPEGRNFSVIQGGPDVSVTYPGFRVIVNHGPNHHQKIARGNWETIGPIVELHPDLAVTGAGVDNVRVELIPRISIGKWIDDFLEKQGYRPALWDELLAVTHKHAQSRNYSPICVVAKGWSSPTSEAEERRTLVVCGKSSGLRQVMTPLWEELENPKQYTIPMVKVK